VTWQDVSGTKKALLVGVNYRGTSNELQGCINDVINQKTVLMQQYNFEEQNIMMITEDEPKDRWPTKEGIINGLGWLFSGAKPGDLLYFAYSGHGTQYSSLTGTSDAICPLDCIDGAWPSSLLLDTELHKHLFDPLPKGCKAVAIFDCCHSGNVASLTVKRDMGAVKAKPRYMKPPYWSGMVDDHLGGGIVKAVMGEKYTDHLLWVFSGCQDDQTSADAYEEGMSQGAFTWAYLRALRADVWHATYVDLLDQIRANLKGHGYSQNPALTTTNAGYLTSWFAGRVPIPPTRALPEIPTRKKKALLVGVNYRNTQNELRGCINDINNHREILQSAYGFQDSDIVTLSEDMSKSDFPTKARIMEELKRLVKGAEPGDFLVFHYSGHGTRITDKSGTEPSGMSDAIVPLDFITDYPKNLILDTEVHRVVYGDLPEDVKMVCIFDSCHSGTMADLATTRTTAPQRYRRARYVHPPAGWDVPNASSPGGGFLFCGGRTPMRNAAGLRQAAADVAGPSKLLLVYSGCQDDQTSADAFEEGSYQGAFTWSFLKAMKAANYSILYSDLLDHLRVALREKGYDQIPALSTTSQENFHHFYLSQRRPVFLRGPCCC